MSSGYAQDFWEYTKQLLGPNPYLQGKHDLVILLFWHQISLFQVSVWIQCKAILYFNSSPSNY